MGPTATAASDGTADRLAPADTAALARGAFHNTLAFLASNLRGIFTLLVARLLGSAVLGTFGVAWAITDLVSKFSTLGFETTALTYVARAAGSADRDRAAWVLRTALRIGLGLSVAIGVAGWIALWPLGLRFGLRPEVAAALGLTLLALPGVALYRISNAASRGMAVMHHDIFSRGLTESLGTAAALLIAMALGARALAPEAAVIAGTLASGLVAYRFARRLFTGTRRAGAGRPLRAFVIDSSAIALYDFFNIAIMQIDVIMLGLFVGRAPGVTLASLGVYAAVVELASGLRKVNQAFSPTLMTSIARHMEAGDLRGAEATFGVLGRWMLAVLLPAAAAMTLAGRAVLLIYGGAFAAGAAWLGFVAVACAMNAFIGLGETMISVERPRMNLANAVLAFGVTIGLNLVLIPRLGPLGAAIGMLVPYTVYGIVRAVEISWIFRWRWPWRALVKPVVAAAVPLAPALAVHALADSWLAALASALLYVGGYLATWRVIGLDDTDRQLVSSLLGRRTAA